MYNWYMFLFAIISLVTFVICLIMLFIGWWKEQKMDIVMQIINGIKIYEKENSTRPKKILMSIDAYESFIEEAQKGVIKNAIAIRSDISCTFFLIKVQIAGSNILGMHKYLIV